MNQQVETWRISEICRLWLADLLYAKLFLSNNYFNKDNNNNNNNTTIIM